MPPVAVPLEPYTNQVGGHNHIFRFSRRAICKPLASNENKFYEALEHAHPELLAFVPQYLGVLNVTYRKADPESEEAVTATPTREIFRNKDDPEAADQSTEIPEVALEQNQHILPGSDVWDIFNQRGRKPAPSAARKHMRFMRRSSGLATTGHTPRASPAPSSRPGSCKSDHGDTANEDGARRSSNSPPSSTVPVEPFTSPSRPPLTSSNSEILSRSLDEQLTISAKTLLSRRASQHLPPSSASSQNIGTGATRVNRKLCEQVLREVFSNPNLRPQQVWDRGRRLHRRVRMGSDAAIPSDLRQIGERVEGPQSYSPQSNFQLQQKQRQDQGSAAQQEDSSHMRKTKSDTSMPSLMHDDASNVQSTDDHSRPGEKLPPAPATSSVLSPASHDKQQATPEGSHVSEKLEKELSMASTAAERRVLLRHQDKSPPGLPPLSIPRDPSPSRQEQFLLMVSLIMAAKLR